MAARFCPGLGSGPVLLHTVLPGATSPGEQLVFFRVPQILVSHLKTKPNLDIIVKPYFFFNEPTRFNHKSTVLCPFSENKCT